MNKVYYLSTCDTCKSIIKEVGFANYFQFQDIKFEKITENQLDEMKELAGSFEALFSRRSRNYKVLGLSALVLTERDYKKYILSDYTFLKRPVIIFGNRIFIGNSKIKVEELKAQLQ